MKKALFWIVVGGLSFWLPGFIYIVASHNAPNLVALNVLYLADLAVLIAVSWFVGRTRPDWGWILAGIYILGPISQLAPSMFVFHPYVANPSSDLFWSVVICLLPPMTLWLAFVNLTIVAVALATVVLSYLTLSRSLR